VRHPGAAAARGDIADEIERRGTTLPGSDRAEKAKYVGTILWRNGVIFENREREGYRLKGMALEESRNVDIFRDFGISKE
jgi:hypothetical protein